MPRLLPGYLRLRVVKTGAGGSVITEDLPHPHISTWQTRALIPGNPGSAALGAFTIPLWPPYTRQYKAAKAIYDQLDYYMRVEAYIGYSAASIGLGKLAFAGIVDEIVGPEWGPGGPLFELRGKSDLLLAHLSRPFPGELTSNDVTSALIKSFLGTNEFGFGDAFNPFTSGNYNSTNVPGFAAGTWTGTTDDNLNVVTCSTGSGAALISKTGAAVGDRWHTLFVEATGRLKPSSDATNAGTVGIGFSSSASSLSSTNTILGQVVAKLVNGRYLLNAQITDYSGGVANAFAVFPNILSEVDDPNGYIPLTIGLLYSLSGNSAGTAQVTLTVNGRPCVSQFVNFVPDPGTGTLFPFLQFSTPGSGTANVYLTNFVQLTRFANDGPSSASTFIPGSIPATTTSLKYGVDAGPTFLEMWSRLATRNGHYLRYTPQAYKAGVRTLGSVDMATTPGNDLTAKVILERKSRTLMGLSRSANADYLVADSAMSGQPSSDGGGIGYWRDVGTLSKYGVVQNEVLAFLAPEFGALRRNAQWSTVNKLAVGTAGSKTAIVPRTGDTAEKYDVLDKVLVNDPETNIKRLSALIVGRDFVEGAGSEVVYLDQFGRDLLI